MRNKSHKFTVELELDDSELETLCSNSVERVFNNAIEVGSSVEGLKAVEVGLREHASILWQDCEELKPLFRKIQQRLQDRVFELRLR